jgi:phosphatidylglycerol---prolipoprotein diacylglyceryl transferase
MSAMPMAFLPSPARGLWHLGPIPFRAQELAIAGGIIVAIVIADRGYRHAGGPRGVITDIAAWAIPAGLIPTAIGALTAASRTQPWQGVHSVDAIVGPPGAVALGTLAAWLGCRCLRPPSLAPAALPAPPASPAPSASPAPLTSPAPAAPVARRVKFAPVLAAAAPAIAFGAAVAQLGAWFTQQGFGHPSSLPWAVEISPVHRPPGYENFATFTPIFLYQAIWYVTAGIAVVVVARRLRLSGDRVFALGAAAYAAAGFGLFWLGIGHLPIIFGLRAGELGDAAVLVGSAVYLARTRRTRIRSVQAAHKPALESDSPVM